MDFNTEQFKKTLDTSTTNGNNVLDPVLLTTSIVEQVRIMPVLRNMIHRIEWPTKYFYWDSVTDPGEAITATDSAVLTFQDASFRQDTVGMSYYYGLAAISNPAIRAARSLVDVVAMRVGQAVDSILRKEGSAIFNGDPNNGTNVGLNYYLSNSTTASVIGANATLSRYMLTQMDIFLRANGYTPGVFIVSPNIYAFISQVAYNQVRYPSVEGPAKVGFDLSPGGVYFNGTPVVLDPYAAKTVAVSGASMVAGSGSTNFKFASGGNDVNGKVHVAAGQDYAGTTWAAPVITVSGTVVSNYSFQADGSITFTSTPGATPVATFAWAQENVYLLSLNPDHLEIADNLPLCVDNDLANLPTFDGIYLRAKLYSTLAVKNPLAHILAANVVIPASITSF